MFCPLYLNFKDKLHSHKQHVLLVICVFTLYLHGIPLNDSLSSHTTKTEKEVNCCMAKQIIECVCVCMCGVGILDCNLFSGQGLM